MKVVLFCGGLGMRLRESLRDRPEADGHASATGPILWHVMKYYAHYGHKDFILCLGYKADMIKNYFLNYDECVSNDFVLSGRRAAASRCCTATSTTGASPSATRGCTSNIGQRLKAVQKHLEGEEFFFANYTDGLTDLPLDRFDRPVRRERQDGRLHAGASRPTASTS